MSQVRPTKITTITNDEVYDLALHLARLADSARVVIPVVDKAERDGLAALFGGTLPVPTVVSRLDLLGTLQVWDGSKWRGPARGEIGSTSNAGQVVTGTSLNVPLEVNITLDPDRRLRVQAQIEASADTNGVFCSYFIRQGGTGTGFSATLRSTTKRFNTAGSGEGVPEFSGRYNTGAGGTTRFSLMAQTNAGLVTSNAGQVTLIIDDMGPA